MAQEDVLKILEKRPSTIGELTELLGISRGSVTTNISKLRKNDEVKLVGYKENVRGCGYRNKVWGVKS